MKTLIPGYGFYKKKEICPYVFSLAEFRQIAKLCNTRESLRIACMLFFILKSRTVNLFASLIFYYYISLFNTFILHHMSLWYFLCVSLKQSFTFFKLTNQTLMSRYMTKPTKWLCAQRRLRSAWASAQSDLSLRCPHEESLGGSLATHWAHSEDSVQTGQMPRLIWVFAGRTATLLVLTWGGSNCLHRAHRICQEMHALGKHLPFRDGPSVLFSVWLFFYRFGLVLRAGCGIWLYQFLIIAYPFTLPFFC